MSFSLLNKLTLIANLAFLVSLAMRYYPLLQGTITQSTILVTGLVLSVILNICWLGVVVYRRFYLKPEPNKNLTAFLNLMIILVQFILLLSGILHITEA